MNLWLKRLKSKIYFNFEDFEAKFVYKTKTKGKPNLTPSFFKTTVLVKYIDLSFGEAISLMEKVLLNLIQILIWSVPTIYKDFKCHTGSASTLQSETKKHWLVVP